MKLLGLLGNTATDAARQTAAFSYDRVAVLADNIANIDTPGYRSRDLSQADFQKTLQDAIASGRRSNKNSGRLELPNYNTPDSKKSAEAAGLRKLVFHDENDRNVEQLMVELVKSSTLQAQVLGAARAQNNTLRSVISESVGQ